jgi:hypothetical protein
MSLCVAAFTNNQRTAIKLCDCDCDGSMFDKKKPFRAMLTQTQNRKVPKKPN